MKILRTLPLIIVLCMFVSLPLDAVSGEKTSHVKETSLAKSVKKAKSAKKESRRETGKEAKKSSRKTVAEKAKFSDDEKEIWMKRARSSDIYTGKASWYGRDFHNKKTASGINYDMYTFTAAHRTLPIGTVVKVTDQHNGKNVLVCITDRGPYVHGRIIDLSYAAARKLNLEDRGVSNVNLEVLSDEKGMPLKSGHAYFVKYKSDTGIKEVGPYNGYADAAAMHEAIRQAHPDAEVVMENTGK